MVLTISRFFLLSGMSFISSWTLSGLIEKFTTDLRLAGSQSLPRFHHFFNIRRRSMQSSHFKQSKTVYDGNWFTIRVAYLIFLMTNSWATPFIPPGPLMAKIFIVSDLLIGFQNDFNQSKLAKNIGLALTISSYIGFATKLPIHNGCRQKQLGVEKVTGFCWSLLLSLLTLSTILNFLSC